VTPTNPHPAQASGAPETVHADTHADGSNLVPSEPSILVVADADLYSRLNVLAEQASNTEPGTSYAPGWLAALGTLGRPACPKPHTIIGPVSAMSGMAPATVTALAELTPSTRLILLSDEDSCQVADRAKTANPACLIWPTQLADATLRTLLGAEAPAAKKANQPQCLTSPEAEAPVQTAAEPATAHEAADQPTQTPTAQPAKETAPKTTQKTAQKTAVDSTPFSDTGLDIGLGDTDLVDAVMTGGGRVKEMALKLIEQQSGLQNVRLTQDKNETRGLAIGRFGQLTADNLQSMEQLAVWSQWLNKWLTLDKQMHTMTTLAMHDELTDVWNRRYFNRFLTRILDRASEQRLQVTVLVFDIDDFKTYNDKYGHAAGDEILTETARLMKTVVREHDVVARIGGDEFAVIFWETQQAIKKVNGRKGNSRHPDDVMAAANRFQKAICQHRFTKLSEEAPGTLTISGGIATFPWDGRTPQELVEVADQMAYKSKQQGKNAITFGPGVHKSHDDCS